MPWSSRSSAVMNLLNHFLGGSLNKKNFHLAANTQLPSTLSHVYIDIHVIELTMMHIYSKYKHFVTMSIAECVQMVKVKSPDILDLLVEKQL